VVLANHHQYFQAKDSDSSRSANFRTLGPQTYETHFVIAQMLQFNVPLGPRPLRLLCVLEILKDHVPIKHVHTKWASLQRHIAFQDRIFRTSPKFLS
jgi:hypothetical protein